MSKKILVTGGTGYIGSHTVVELLAAGHEVEILDNLFNSKESVLDRIAKIAGVRPVFHKVDLLDYEATEQILARGFGTVIHFAGLKAVGESVEKPLWYYENNIGGTISLLKAMAANGCREIIFSSSATVYGDPGTPEYVETMPTGRNISNPYGQTKYMIEQILCDAVAGSEFEGEGRDGSGGGESGDSGRGDNRHEDDGRESGGHDNGGLKVVTLRYFNPVGAHPSGLLGEDPNGIPNNLMPIIMKVARGEIKELSVYGDDYPTADGTCRRDYIHVVDLAKGHLAAMGALEKMGGRGSDTADNGEGGLADDNHVEDGRSGDEKHFVAYNLGSGTPNSVLEMVAAFEKASGEKLPYKIAPRRAGDLAEFWANPKKAFSELGWKTELSIDDAMRDTLKFLKNS